MAPAPVHMSSLPVCRLSGSQRTYPPSKGFSFGKHAPVKRSPCSILKKSPQIRGTPKKKVRFSLPGERNAAADESSSHFKGFTTGVMDKLRISIENIKGLEKSLTVRQKIAVEETIRRKSGAIPIKVGKRKGYLCRKKLDCPISKIEQVDKTVNVSVHESLPHKQLIYLESRKMQCRICKRVAYIPGTQQQTDVGSSNYFCNDCFERSAMCTIPPSASQLNAPKTGVALRNPPTVTTTTSQVADLLGKSEIIISSVRSLADTMACNGPDKLMDELLDDIERPLFSPAKMEKPEPEIVTNSEQYGHQVNKVIPQEKLEGKTKFVTVWTAEGLFTVRIPCSGEERDARSTKPLSNEKRVVGTDEDLIYIDD